MAVGSNWDCQPLGGGLTLSARPQAEGLAIRVLPEALGGSGRINSNPREGSLESFRKL